MKRGANTTIKSLIASTLRLRAFTLIELLVVIGIIAALIGLLVPLIRKVQSSAHGAATQAQLVTIANAIQQYYGDFHAYPGPLPNSQIAAAYQSIPPPAPFPLGPTIPDPTNPTSNPPLGLTYYDPVSQTDKSLPSANEEQHITGSENLVLGLIGGLQITTGPNGAPPAHLEYNPALIFPDGITPNPAGALSLNYQKPKRFQAYLQVRAGDISHPNANVNGGEFTDNTGVRHALDSIIPEFVDQYGDQMPILYLRTYVGGTAIASFGGIDETTGAQMTDPNTNQPVTAQYDLAQIYDYTQGKPGKGIFTIPDSSSTGTTHNPRAYHGLQHMGSFKPVVTTHPGDDITVGWWDNSSGFGYNAVAYLKDPNNAGTQNIGGHARQKDAFLLISAGPDRIYGTDDDIIYPGSLQP